MKKHKLADKFLKELEKVPLVEMACKNIGVTRQTVYRWKKEDSDFAQKMDDTLFIARGIINDLGESQLIKLMKSGDFKSIKFWMEHNSERYASPKWRMDHMTGHKEGAGLAEFIKEALERQRQKKERNLNP